MVKEMPIPKTVGDLIKVLEGYPKDADLAIFATEIYDNGGVYEQQAAKMRIQSFNDYGVEEKYPVFITIANGYTLPKEDGHL